MSEPVSDNCNHAQLFALPASLFRNGTNVLDLKVVGHRREEVGSRWRAGALSALTIGPQAELAPRQGWHRSLAAAAAPGASATLLLLGGFMFVLGFIHRRESHLAYFGAVALTIAALDVRHWLRQFPIGHPATEWLWLCLLGLATWGTVQFLLRYAGARLRAADIGLPLQAAAIPLVLLAGGRSRLADLATFWYVVLALQVLAAAAFYLRRRWPSTSGRLLAALLATLTLALGAEAQAQWRPEFEPPPPLLQWLLPAALVLTGLRLVQQHGRALQHAQEGQQQLEVRVREATAEIEHNFRQIAELKVEQVTERERKRIAADLHDDLGAKLLTIVHTSDNERISTLAREALEEMRLSVRGLTGKPVPLVNALGDWRAEFVLRLSQAGVDGSWHAPADDDVRQLLSARAFVQTTRVLREAVSNIIKHSDASRCTVRCTIAEGDFQVVIQDNGKGIPMELDGRLDRGHGMASMKHRAKQLQGQCLVESGPGYGTVIRLTIPLDRHLASA
jgi:signal transduction histidine kinase